MRGQEYVENWRKSDRFGEDGEISVAAWRKLEREKACAEAGK